MTLEGGDGMEEKKKHLKKWGGEMVILFSLLYNSKYVHLKKLNIYILKHIIENFAWQCNTEVVKFIQKSAMYSSIVKIP